MNQEAKVLKHKSYADYEDVEVAVPLDAILPCVEFLKSRFVTDESMIPTIHAAVVKENSYIHVEILHVGLTDRDTGEWAATGFVGYDGMDYGDDAPYNDYKGQDWDKIINLVQSAVSEYYQEHPPVYPVIEVPGYKPVKLDEGSTLQIEFTGETREIVMTPGGLEEDWEGFQTQEIYEGTPDGMILHDDEIMTAEQATADIQKMLYESRGCETALYVWTGEEKIPLEENTNRSKEQFERE